MGKLERELQATLNDLIEHFTGNARKAEDHVDSISSWNRVHGAIAAQSAVEQVLKEGYVYYGQQDGGQLRPAIYWTKLDGGAWLAIAEGESRMPWDEVQPITQMPAGGLVHRNSFGTMVDPRRKLGHCSNCGLNPSDDAYVEERCLNGQGIHDINMKENSIEPGVIDPSERG